jgi:dUTP pyrophosphatase
MDIKNLDEIGLSEYAKKLQQMIDEGGNGEFDYDMIMNDFGLDVKSLEDDLKNYNPKLPLGFIKLHPDAITPKYNYETDSGFDLHSVEEIVIPPFGRALIPTGIYFDLPQDFEIQVRSKSGLAINQGLMVLNSPGTVDEGYTGEIKVIIFNTNQSEFKIEKGMKVAQAVVARCVTGRWVNLVEVNQIKEKDRGENGFGSTGI